MKKIFSTIAAIGLFATIQAAEWGYEKHNGPDTWGNIEGFEACEIGMKQSPIDILEKGTQSVKNELKIHYLGELQEILNNGHTLQINTKNENYVYFKNVKYTLHQFHFHTPSENHINSKEYPLEAHFVHKNDKNQLLVIAVMFKENVENPELVNMIKHLPKEKNHSVAYGGIEIKKLLQSSHGYFEFDGSLTTPPCSEGVTWVVLKTPLTASKEQIKAFNDIMGNNNRSFQPLNGRVIKSAS